MKRFGIPALAALLLAPMAAASQDTDQTQRVEGLRDNTPGVHAFTNARVVTAPGEELDGATLVIRDGVIEEVGQGVSAPDDARVWDMEGHTIYPGFIDAHAYLGMDEGPENGEAPEAHWNTQVRAHFDAGTELDDDEDARHHLRAQGFTTANAIPRLGIFRGQSAVVSLSDEATRHRLIEPGVAQSMSFTRSFELGGGYPSSLMGTMALMRQTLHDAQWHEEAWATYDADPSGLSKPERSRPLEELAGVLTGDQPLVFETRMEEDIPRAKGIAEEFGTDVWLMGSGEEYRLLDVLDGDTPPMIVPVDFPAAPDVEAPEDALNVDLATLRHWYRAPENPGALDAQGIDFALTADGLDDPGDFLANVREAVARGLDPASALGALTTAPAELLGIDNRHGTLEGGKVANLVVADGDLFQEDAEIRDVWVDGQRYGIELPERVDPRGEWTVTSVDDGRFDGRLELEGPLHDLQGSITLDGETVELSSASARTQSGRLRVAFPGSVLEEEGLVRLSASVEGDEAYGWTELPGRTGPSWRGERTASAADNPAAERQAPEPVEDLELADIRPAMEFGREALPEQPEHVLVENATVWTQGPEGVIEDGDLLVSNGEVEAVGQDLDAPSGAEVIDGSGKHVTPGLIDAHLHSGIQGVNEGTSNAVPEVRMEDVLTHNTAWTYRQVAGGLTTAHLMHGSANPIGGQNVFVKMRWGGLPEDLIMEDQPRTVKFALGENVVGNTYPGTRMGVEQFIRDHFEGARDYQERWDEWEANGDGLPPRRDLRTEAVWDIMNEEISIQSHGYRQDEFLMLVRLAEEFDFGVDAIHHGVEAYRIAPELAESDVAAVVWSDWSSFKVEAYEATTYNARLLHEAGVKTSLHSDNSHIATRMNWEAGKVARTGMDQEDALNLVTLNTAKALGIDDRVGSLEPGKDGDFVIWDGNPLSQFTRAEQTWIDGRQYFDLAEDQELRERAEEERGKLLQLLLEDN